MPYTPEEFRSKITPGAVLYFKINPSDPEPHYHIVLNKTPLTDENLIIVRSSHRIADVRFRRKRESPDTLVIIKKEEYPRFTCDESIVDCNSVITEFTLEKLTIKAQSENVNEKIDIRPRMDMAIIQRLREAVCESNIVDRIIQGRLC